MFVFIVVGLLLWFCLFDWFLFVVFNVVCCVYFVWVLRFERTGSCLRLGWCFALVCFAGWFGFGCYWLFDLLAVSLGLFVGIWC